MVAHASMIVHISLSVMMYLYVCVAQSSVCCAFNYWKSLLQTKSPHSKFFEVPGLRSKETNGAHWRRMRH